MLTGYTMAIPIQNKEAETVVTAYRDHVYCIFGGSSSMLTDNGTEFKNEDMDRICTKLGIRRVFTPVYTPECNGKLEGWHKFFKACVAKHIRGNSIEWDELVPLAVVAYNFFPCQASKESPFVLMFGCDPVTPFCQLLEPTPRYWGRKGRSTEDGYTPENVCGSSSKHQMDKRQTEIGRRERRGQSEVESERSSSGKGPGFPSFPSKVFAKLQGEGNSW